MRFSRLQQALALVLVVLTVQGGCVIIPEVKSKIVELVASGTACDTLDAIGILNNHDDTDFFDIKDGINIQEIAEDAGIDLDNVDSVYISGVTYKTTQLDPEPNREIVNGTVTVQRGTIVGGSFVASGSEVPIIENFNVMVNSVTTDQTAPLTAAGIQLIQQLLNECLTEAKGGPDALNTAIQYHVTGVSNPQGIQTNFRWRICVSMNMAAPTEVDVIE